MRTQIYTFANTFMNISKHKYMHSCPMPTREYPLTVNGDEEDKVIMLAMVSLEFKVEVKIMMHRIK